jgi:hypothetical protein
MRVVEDEITPDLPWANHIVCRYLRLPPFTMTWTSKVDSPTGGPMRMLIQSALFTVYRLSERPRTEERASVHQTGVCPATKTFY